MNTFVIKDEARTFKHRFIVASGAAASIAIGVPTKAGSAGAVAIVGDGEGTTSERFTGMAATTSTDTAAAAGEVFTYEPLPGVIYKGSPKTAGSANTQAKIDALQYKRVVFDLTSTTWSVDTAASDASTKMVIICGGDYLSDTVDFYVGPAGTYLSA